MHFLSGKSDNRVNIMSTHPNSKSFNRNGIFLPFVTTSHFKTAFVHIFDIIEL